MEMQQEECVLPAPVDTPYAHLLPQVGYPLTCARPDTMILFIHLRIYLHYIESCPAYICVLIVATTLSYASAVMAAEREDELSGQRVRQLVTGDT